jgi:hypothetical protein
MDTGFLPLVVTFTAFRCMFIEISTPACSQQLSQSMAPVMRPPSRTHDSSLDYSAIFKLNSNRLIRQLHQKSATNGCNHQVLHELQGININGAPDELHDELASPATHQRLKTYVNVKLVYQNYKKRWTWR